MAESVPLDVGAVVMPRAGARDINGNLLPEVPHTVVHPGVAPAVVGLVRTVVHQLVVAAVGTTSSAAAYLAGYQVHVRAEWALPAGPADVDPAIRFRVATGRVHEWVAGRTVCPASTTRPELLARLLPTVDPVDCRDCLRVMAAEDARVASSARRQHAVDRAVRLRNVLALVELVRSQDLPVPSSIAPERGGVVLRFVSPTGERAARPEQLLDLAWWHTALSEAGQPVMSAHCGFGRLFLVITGAYQERLRVEVRAEFDLPEPVSGLDADRPVTFPEVRALLGLPLDEACAVSSC